MMGDRGLRAQALLVAVLVAACSRGGASDERWSEPTASTAPRSEIVLASVVVAPADPPPASDYIRAGDARADVTSPVPIPGTSLVRGRSVVTVQAPLERVREVVLGFGDYPAFMPHYRACRVLGRTATGGRDVYMEVAALHGAVKLWTRVDVSKPVVREGVETVEARFVDGNVKDFRGAWSLRKLDDARTELTVEVFLQPKLPLPDAVLNNENLEGARRAALAFKARSEARGPR